MARTTKTQEQIAAEIRTTQIAKWITEFETVTEEGQDYVHTICGRVMHTPFRAHHIQHAEYCKGPKPKKVMQVVQDIEGTGTYSCTVCLKPGTYEYKFIVDGQWLMDPGNQNFVPNDQGSLNSVIVVE